MVFPVTLTAPDMVGVVYGVTAYRSPDGYYVICGDRPLGDLSDADLRFIAEQTDGIKRCERGQLGDFLDGDRFAEAGMLRGIGYEGRYALRVWTERRAEWPRNNQWASIRAFTRHIMRAFEDPTEFVWTNVLSFDFDWQPIYPAFKARCDKRDGVRIVVRCPQSVAALPATLMRDLSRLDHGLKSVLLDPTDPRQLIVSLAPTYYNQTPPPLTDIARLVAKHLPLYGTDHSPLSSLALTFDELQVGMWVEIRSDFTATHHVVTPLGNAGAKLLVAAIDRNNSKVMLINPDRKPAEREGINWRGAASLGLMPYDNPSRRGWSMHFYVVRSI